MFVSCFKIVKKMIIHVFTFDLNYYNVHKYIFCSRGLKRDLFQNIQKWLDTVYYLISQVFLKSELLYFLNLASAEPPLRLKHLLFRTPFWDKSTLPKQAHHILKYSLNLWLCVDSEYQSDLQLIPSHKFRSNSCFDSPIPLQIHYFLI